jgi:8-oxo-dGTP pyrophosphatase MutT (NUDIX family)
VAATTLIELIASYRPATPAEATDVATVDELARSGDPWHRDQPVHVTCSALIVHPLTERVLLRWHKRQQSWLQVGGHADPGEDDPIAIATREGVEETGLTDLVPWPASRLLHVAVVPVPGNEREPPHHHADLRFTLATARPDDAVPESTQAPIRWLSVPEARRLTAEENVRETLARVNRLFQTVR